MSGLILGALLFSSTVEVGSMGGGLFIEAYTDLRCQDSILVSANTITSIYGIGGNTILERGNLESVRLCTPYQNLLNKAKEEMKKKAKETK